MKTLLVILGLSLLCVTNAFAAGSCDFSCTDDGKGMYLQWVCTSDAAAGNVSTPTMKTVPNATGKIGCAGRTYSQPVSGVVRQAWVIPGTGGVAPDALYDVELRPTSDTSVDLLGGLGDNCPQATTKWGMPVDEVNAGVIKVPNTPIQPYAAAMNNSKQMTLKVYVVK